MLLLFYVGTTTGTTTIELGTEDCLLHMAGCGCCRAPEGWQYSTGFINEDMVKEHLLPAGPDSIVAMCGPPPMIKFACIPNLEKVGYKEEQMVQF
jgi:Na+-transporting NADH:ubiquinone oxidoreductase subunit NqrF